MQANLQVKEASISISNSNPSQDTILIIIEYPLLNKTILFIYQKHIAN